MNQQKWMSPRPAGVRFVLQTSLLSLATSALWCVAASSANAAMLGPAMGYNVFVRDDLFQDTIHVQGLTAVGGNITSTQSYGIGDRIGSGNVLIVGGDINLGGTGQVYGDALYGGNSAVANVTGSLSNGSLIDFNAAFTQLEGISAGFAGPGAIAASSPDASGLIQLSGSDPNLNVFEISQLSNTVRYQIDTPDTSTTVINILGTNLALGNGNFAFQVADDQINRVIYNFPEATSLTAQSIGFRGNLLAPLAQADLDNGQILGTAVFRGVEEIPQVGGVFEYNQLAASEIVDPPPAMPTPAMLPGMLGMLWQSWRKRRIAVRS